MNRTFWRRVWPSLLFQVEDDSSHPDSMMLKSAALEIYDSLDQEGAKDGQ